MSSLQERLKLVRGTLTQAEFAAQMGVPTNTIGRYERGEFKPDSSFLQKLGSKFGVSLDWLVFGLGEKSLSDKNEHNTAVLCSNCSELIILLKSANDRLYQATERERELLKEVNLLKEDYLLLKNKILTIDSQQDIS